MSLDVDYSHRILCDPDFFRGIKQRSDCKTILRNLMYIKASSKWQKEQKGHNVMIKEDFKQIQNEKILFDNDRNKDSLGAFVKDIECPLFLQKESDVISKRIRHAIYLSNFPPYRTFILTSTDKVNIYKSNQHFMNVKSAVSIKSLEEAVIVLNDFFKKYTEFKELRRSFVV